MHRSTVLSALIPAQPRSARRTPAGVVVASVALAIALLIPGSPAKAAPAVTPDQWGGTYADGGNSGTNAGEHTLTSTTVSRIRPAWTKYSTTTAPYPPVVLGGVVYGIGSRTVGNAAYPQFTASSPRTGAVLWTMSLPVDSAQYGYGLAGSGHTVVVAVRANPGGLLAVDTSTRRIAWRAKFPPSTIDGFGNDYSGLPITDGSRVYVSGSSNSINAYSLTTGAKLWSVPYTIRPDGRLNGVDGIAAGGGYVYTSGNLLGVGGLVAYTAATGKRVWASTTPEAYRPPVLAGGRVFVSTTSGVAAYAAAGCGSTRCAPVWTRTVPSYDVGGQTVSSANGSSVFVTSRIAATGASECGERFVGTVTRLSASTGSMQWRVQVGSGAVGLIRGGDVVWLLNEYRSAANGCASEDRILGFSAAQTGRTPVSTIDLPSEYWGFPQTLAVASGTLLESRTALVGYRIPNT